MYSNSYKTSSNQLVSSLKGTFVNSPKTRKVTRVSMVNMFWLGHVNQGFPSGITATLLALLWQRASSIQLFSYIMCTKHALYG